MTTGPGEIIPIATASRNVRSESQWYWSTTYVFRNGTITRPLPKTKNPVLKKKRKSFDVIAPPVLPSTPSAAAQPGGGGATSRPGAGATAGGAKTKVPSAPATRKIAVSSF